MALVFHLNRGDRNLSRYKHQLANTNVVTGKRMDFNGTSAKMGLPNSAILNMSGTSVKWTFTTWLKPNSLSAVMAIAHHNPSWQFLLRTTGRLELYVWGKPLDLFSATATALIANKWAQVGFTVSASRLAQIYINSEPDKSGDSTGTIGTPTSGLYLGARGYNNDQWLDGELDDTKIYRDEAKSANWFKDYYERNLKYH